MSTPGRANILIVTAQVPFTKGGVELQVELLRRELELRDYTADVVSLPFGAIPKETLLNQVAIWRALDLTAFAGRKVDLVIATKFPSYMVKHPCKVLWLVHQHRQLYDLYGTRFTDFHSNMADEALRQLIVRADEIALRECKRIYTISPNVTERLRAFLGIESTPLAPPLPLGTAYRVGDPQDYILSVGRLCSSKRVDLIIKAMAQIAPELKLKIAGVADEPGIESYLESEIDKHHLWERVEFLGRVNDQTLLSLYARAFAVYYAPFDEDYGFVTLEALASGRPLVTAHDSGGVLEFIRDEENGLIVEAHEQAIANAMNRLFTDRSLYERLARGAKESQVHPSWDEVIGELTNVLDPVGEGMLDRVVAN